MRPVLDYIASTTGETVHLLVLEGTEIVFLDGVESRHVIRAAARSGQRAPAHTSASGKALLAGLDTDELRRRYPNSRLHGGTTNALTTRKALSDELGRVRELGYAINLPESEPDLHAVAFTIEMALRIAHLRPRLEARCRSHNGLAFNSPRQLAN